MMPIVFWASLAPWFRLKNAADTSWSRLNVRSTRDGGVQRNAHRIASIRPKPSAIPMIGDRKMNRMVLVQPPGTSAANPAFATAAPGVAADQGVRRAGRQAEVPGDQIPDDRAGEAAEDDGKGHHFDVESCRSRRSARRPCRT
jgi:hypothetical protein